MQHTERALIREACRILQRGGVIAIPTETTYGLACDPRKAKAVNRIFMMKGRSESKPLQLIASSFRQVDRLADLTPQERKLGKKHWPGPLTLLVALKPGRKLAPKVCPKRVIGIRVTSGVWARKLVAAYGHALAATSANRSGSKPARSVQGVRRAFESSRDRPDDSIDGGTLPRRKPSTVARISKTGTIEVLRPGAIRL